jgi:predicted Abi (CAAX) family protease
VAADDPRRTRFDQLHSLSTTLVTAIAIAGIAVAAWEARE